MWVKAADNTSRTKAWLTVGALLALVIVSLTGATAGLAQAAQPSRSAVRVTAETGRPWSAPRKPTLDVPAPAGLTSLVAGRSALSRAAKHGSRATRLQGRNSAVPSDFSELAASANANPPQAPAGGSTPSGAASGTGVAGAVGSTTLVLYDTTGTYGSLGQLYAMATANLASHFGNWTAEPVSSYQAGQIGNYTATIYIGSTYSEPLPTAFLNDVYTTTHPVIWIYDNIWELTSAFPAFQTKYGWMWSQFDTSSVAQVKYKGITLSRNASNGGGIMNYASVDTTKAHVLAQAVRSDGTQFPWAVSSGNLTYIGENPYVYSTETDRITAFEDILYNALDPSAPTRHVALLRFEDIDPTWDPADLTGAADTAQSYGAPFGYGIISDYLNPLAAQSKQANRKQATVTSEHLYQSPKVVAALNYMAAHGGTPIMHGYTHQYSNVANPYTGISGDDFEFYRVTENADHSPNFVGPIPGDSTSWALSRVSAATAEFNDARLPVPKIFEFPHYSASAVDYAAIASKFSVRWERSLYYYGQLTGTPSAVYTQAIGEMFPFVVQDVYGNTVLPENLGDYEPEPFYTFPVHVVSDILAGGASELAVRDGVAGVYYHAFNGTQPLAQILSGLKNQGWTFADPAKLSGLAGSTAIANTTPPTISGTAAQGQVLTAGTGSWSGGPTLYGYQWFDCDTSGANCQAIYGANASTYTLQSSDAGSTIRVQVTAAGALYGQALATSAPTAALLAAPTNSVAPAISGTPQVGVKLTAANGTWTNAPTKYTYQWSVCDTAWGGCVAQTGATSQTYTPTVDAKGHDVAVTVTATNAAGSTSATSAWTQAVVAAPAQTAPQSTQAPAIAGTLSQGQTLTVSNGTWSGSTPINYNYQWLRCDAQAANCAIISGATAPTYVLTAADNGQRLSAWVSATNAAGSATATAAPTAVVGATAGTPQNTAAPQVNGTPQVGVQLTATTGTWSGSPSSYAYQWAVCDPAWYGCVAQSGATSSTFTPDTSAQGHQVAVTVTATNTAGSTSAISAWSQAVAAAAPQTAPQNTQAPAITGTLSQGQTLTVSNGTWSGSAPINYYYQWLRCDADGANCAIVSGATAATYVLTAADAGSTLSAWVSGANAAGSATATAPATAVVH